MQAQKQIRFSFFSIFFTVFVDSLCWSIVFPVFAPYFLDPHNRLFSPETTEGIRTLILACFLTAFSLGQFFGAPLLGEYADRFGRKKALQLSIFCNFLSLVISAWSMGKGLLILLFVGRLVTGFFSGNMAVCLASLTDLSSNEECKAKNFRKVSSLIGLSFILGAFLGGKLSDQTLHPLFNPSFPLWLAVLLSFLNFLFVAFGFRETAKKDSSVKFDPLESFRHIASALKTKSLKKVYLIYFLFLLGWTLFFQFTPVLVVQKFGFTSSNIGDLSLYMGLCWAFGAIYLNKALLRYFYPLKILEVCLFSFTFLLASLAFALKIYWVVLILGFSVMMGGLAWPLCTGVISNLAPSQMQGKILGISQSMQSLAMTIAPLAGGLAAQTSLKWLFLMGASFSFIAALIYFSLKEV